MKKTTLIVLTVFFFLSCSHDKENVPAPCTTTTAAVAGPYKITAATYQASSTSAETDYYNILFDPCERDDIYTFNAAGTYQIADAGLACSPSSNDNGTWSLTGTTGMVIDGDAVSLESFDCKKLILVNTNIQTQGDRLKLTLTRQ